MFMFFTRVNTLLTHMTTPVRPKSLAFYATRLEAFMDNTETMKKAFRDDLCSQNCWYDTFPLSSDRPAVSLPLRYNEKTDVWEFEGTFCSWACCKRYNHDYKKADPLRSDRESWINQLALRLGYITHTQTVPYALPRDSLSVYGGTLSMEQFRNVPDSILNKYSLKKWNPGFVPIVEVESGIVSDPSPLASVLVRRDTMRKKRSTPDPDKVSKLQMQSYPKRMVVHTRDEMQMLPCTDIPALDDIYKTLQLPGCMNTSEKQYSHLVSAQKPVVPSGVVMENTAIVPRKSAASRSFFNQKL